MPEEESSSIWVYEPLQGTPLLLLLDLLLALMFMGARVEKRSHVLKLIVNNSFGPQP